MLLSKEHTLPQFSKRLSVIGILISIAGVIIVGRLFEMQILDSALYKDQATKQYRVEQNISADRAEIFFKNKDGDLITAAAMENGFEVYVDSRTIGDVDYVYDALRKYYVDISKNDLLAKMSDKNDPYEVLIKFVSKDIGVKIAEERMSGIGLVPRFQRTYPMGNMASHVLGFVSSDENFLEGKYGIEKMYNNILEGDSGFSAGEADAHGFLFALGSVTQASPKIGEPVILSIEPEVQQYTEQILTALKERWGAKLAGAMIIEPKTGKIRALAATPSFDPNQYYNVENFDTFLNPFTQKIFEMGSVFKPLTIAAGLDSGRINKETTYIDYGFVEIDGHKISNFDGKARGKTDIKGILAESLNTGAVFVMQQMGGTVLRDYLYKFGLGEVAGKDFPGELAGDLRNLDSERSIEFATASFGQGIAVTPIGLTSALSALANDGIVLQPTILENDNQTMLRRVVSKEAAESVTSMLVEVVDTVLAGGNVHIPGYSIAAKTGTAQIPNKLEGGYSDEFLHSFFGYFPAYDPEVLIFLFLEEPQEVRYASQTLSDPFKKLTEFLINYYIIPPDR